MKLNEMLTKYNWLVTLLIAMAGAVAGYADSNPTITVGGIVVAVVNGYTTWSAHHAPAPLDPSPGTDAALKREVADK